tara:strand:+ start:17739 stop:18959 length:1221 start_codon:yes stop_codon:yes gene_type:complete
MIKNPIEKISELTNINISWKTYNPLVLDSYNCLHPAQLSKTSIALYSMINYNKMNRKEEDPKFNAFEQHRRYNTLSISLEDILKRSNPVKYGIEKKDIANDLSNLKKTIHQLDENNIFYVWRYKQPFTYMFFIEPDIWSWKYYNPNAYIGPINVRRVLCGTDKIIKAMISFEEKRERTVSSTKIEESCGEFFGQLIKRMNPKIQSSLTQWDGGNVKSYSKTLIQELNKLEDYEGVEISNDFIDRLPEYISRKIGTTLKKKKRKGDNMDVSELEAALVPKNENLVVQKKAKKTKVKGKDGINAKIHRTKRLDPFKNPNNLLDFYKSAIKLHNNEAKFFSFTSEVHLAEEVLDALTEGGRDNDIQFLKSWIKYFAGKELSGDKAKNEHKTSLSSFKSTFNKYNKSYVS